MYIKKICLLLVITLTIFLIGCNFDRNITNRIKNESINDNNTDNKAKREDEVIVKDSIELLVDSMTIDEKIGQMFILGFQGTTVDETLKDLIEQKNIGGVILFSENIKDIYGTVDLTNQLKEINKLNKAPLFISVDEEGGIVSRVPYEFESLPSSSYFGEINDKNVSYQVGEVLAEIIRSLGFNTDFAPVLDIFSNPNNTVIGDRAFGSTAEIVSKLGIKTMEGLRDSNVIPVVKHFPGHGDTDVDSHYGLPYVEKSLEELRNFEFIPFKEAIDNGADSVMVSHIVLSQIDSNNPATMSKAIVTDILRNELGFEGVVFTDDMTMGAILNNFDIGEAAVKAINAGTDVILICHGYENQYSAINAVKVAVESGEISEERINESVYRILKLKDKYKFSNETIDNNIDIETINNKIRALNN